MQLWCVPNFITKTCLIVASFCFVQQSLSIYREWSTISQLKSVFVNIQMNYVYLFCISGFISSKPFTITTQNAIVLFCLQWMMLICNIHSSIMLFFLSLSLQCHCSMFRNFRFNQWSNANHFEDQTFFFHFNFSVLRFHCQFMVKLYNGIVRYTVCLPFIFSRVAVLKKTLSLNIHFR